MGGGDLFTALDGNRASRFFSAGPPAGLQGDSVLSLDFDHDTFEDFLPVTAGQTYEFTALLGADILAPGDQELGCGDMFEMPSSATVCIAVTDNDSSLSGDARRNERGDDRSYQTADVKIDGVLVQDNVKIYAEEYYTLQDQYGNCYRLIEIEVACSSGTDQTDYYAFDGAVPPAGAELTVTGRGNVCGDWIDYRDLSAGLKWEFDDGKLTVEAEDMALTGYRVEDVQAASGGEVIRLKEDVGEASMTFGAQGGTYDLELAYIDENDGQGQIELWVNDTLIETIDLTQDDGGSGYGWTSISTAKITDVTLQQGDQIVLRGIQDAWEYARIDALTFCEKQNAPPVAIADAAVITEDQSLSLDLLANDSDPDGDPLVVTLAGGDAPGTPISVTTAEGRSVSVLVSAAGILSFDTAGDFEAMGASDSDSFALDYTITDGKGETATATASSTCAPTRRCGW